VPKVAARGPAGDGCSGRGKRTSAEAAQDEMRENRFALASERGLLCAIIAASMLALAGPSQASSQVKVLVAGLYGRCPCLSAGFTGPARRAHGHMTDRTGREGRNQLENRRSGGMWPLRPSGL